MGSFCSTQLLSLDEAIEHAKEIADQHKDTACGLNHLQLYTWLLELRNFKAREPAIKNWFSVFSDLDSPEEEAAWAHLQDTNEEK